MAIEILERNAIISGVGKSAIGRRTGRSPMDLSLESVLAAIADAGLTRDDIDGLASVAGPGEVPVADLQNALRLDLNWYGGGLTFGMQFTPIVQAAFAVAAGLARHVLIYRTLIGANMGAGVKARRAAAIEEAATGRVSGANQWIAPYAVYGALAPHALLLRRHMYEYGTTKEQLGWVPVTQRYHAGLNDAAVYREPLSLDEYLESRPICEPLSLFDCDVPVDGSMAFVVSAADHATDLPNAAIRIHAVGGGVASREFLWDLRGEVPRMVMVEAAEQMWSRTDLTPADVDVAELYDGFSVMVLQWLETLGFCKVGEGGAFVEGGRRIRLGGELPVNTYGGQLSAGRMHGSWVLHEACLQLRGQAGPRQVPDAEVAVATVGNLPGACMLLTR